MAKMYYYTSTDTMCKILQNGNLFATNIKYMNDAQEYLNGLAEIRKLCLGKKLFNNFFQNYTEEQRSYFSTILQEEMTEKRMNEFMEDNNRYSISFCRDKDLLSQWTTYARESGVSIAMDFDDGQDLCFLFHAAFSGLPEKIRYYTQPKEILYLTEGRGESTYDDTAKKILEQMFPEGLIPDDFKSKLLDSWKNNSVYIKQYDFYQEQEYRIAFNYSYIEKNGGCPRIDYRNDKHVIKPYLDVECENGWPIVSVMAGPGFNQQIVYRSIKFFLDHANIKSSKLRLKRQWAKQIQSYLSFAVKEPCAWIPKLEEDKEKRQAEEWEQHFNDFSQQLARIIVDNKADEIKKDEAFSFYTKVNDLVKEYCNLNRKAEDCSLKIPYFSKSGVILECSQTPYIY